MSKSTPFESKELLTPREVAEAFGVVPKTVTRWAVEEKIHSIRTPGGQRRYYRAEIEALLEGGDDDAT